MEPDDIGGLVARFYEGFDHGDLDAATSVFSESLETTDPGMGTVHGLAPTTTSSGS